MRSLKVKRQRFCIVADYLRALRVLGAVSPGVQERWRLVCNTADPLVSGSRAASQLRRFVDFVEQEVSIPEGFPHVDFIRDADGGAALEASRHWAENVMAITLDMGSSRIRSVEGAVPTGSGATVGPMVGSAPVESSAGAAVSASEFVEVQEEVRESERLLRPGLSLWQVPPDQYPPTPFSPLLPSSLTCFSPQPPSSYPSFGPACHCGRSRLVPLLTLLAPLPLWIPHSILFQLLLSLSSFTPSKSPACHCGRSRLTFLFYPSHHSISPSSLSLSLFSCRPARAGPPWEIQSDLADALPR